MLQTSQDETPQSKKDTIRDESFEEIMNWGSPLSRASDSIASSPGTATSSMLDFLDDEDESVSSFKNNTVKPTNIHGSSSIFDPDSSNADEDSIPEKIEEAISRSIQDAETIDETITEPHIHIPNLDSQTRVQSSLLERSPKPEFLSSESEDFEIPASTPVENITRPSISESDDLKGSISEPCSVLNQKVSPVISCHEETSNRTATDPGETTDNTSLCSIQGYFPYETVENTNRSSIYSTSRDPPLDTTEHSDTTSIYSTHGSTSQHSTIDVTEQSETTSVCSVQDIEEQQEIAPARLFEPSQTTKFKSSVVSKFVGDTVLTCSRVNSKRYSEGELVDKEINNFPLYAVNIPQINENSFKNSQILKLSDLKIKNTDKDSQNIKEILNLSQDMIFKNDITFTFTKEALNSGACSFREPRSLYQNIVNKSIYTCLEMNMLKFMMGLDYSFEGIEFSPDLFEKVLKLNIPELTKAFILSQKNSFVFFLAFYRLGLVKAEEFAFLYSGNLFYRFVLSKTGLDLFKIPKNKWNVQSLVDLGISKILNVESRKEDKRSPLENLTQKMSTDDEKQPVDMPVKPKKESETFAMSVPEKKCIAHHPDSPVNIQKSSSDVAENELVMHQSLKHTPDRVSEDNQSNKLHFNEENNHFELKKSLFEDNDENDFPFEDKTDTRTKPAIQQPLASKETFYLNSNESVTSVETLDDSEMQNDSHPAPLHSLELIPNDAWSVHSESLQKNGSLASSLQKDGSLASSHNLERIQNDAESAQSEPLQGNSQDLEQTYKKKFSKSFADIFTLENNNTTQQVSENIDVSSYVSDVSEQDKPLLQNEDAESKSTVISSIFGFFKKKGPEPPRSQDDLMMNRATRPLKIDIRTPEKKERTVVQSAYANKKELDEFEIPGFKSTKK